MRVNRRNYDSYLRGGKNVDNILISDIDIPNYTFFFKSKFNIMIIYFKGVEVLY